MARWARLSGLSIGGDGLVSSLRSRCIAEIDDRTMQDMPRTIDAKPCMATEVKQVQPEGAAIRIDARLAHARDAPVPHERGHVVGLDVKQFADKGRIEDEVVTVAFDLAGGCCGAGCDAGGAERIGIRLRRRWGGLDAGGRIRRHRCMPFLKRRLKNPLVAALVQETKPRIAGLCQVVIS